MARKSKKTPPARKPAKTPAPRSAAGRRVIPGLVPPGLPFSAAVAVGNVLFVSGTTPFDKSGGIARGDFAAQMHQTMANIADVLKAAGSSWDKVAKMNVILTRVSDFWTMNDIYKQYFTDGNYPARTTIEAPLAHPDFLIEIECVAAI